MILQQNTLVVDTGWQLCSHTSKKSRSNGQDGGFVIDFSITFWWTRVRFHLFSFFFRFFKLLFNDQARKKIERPFWRFHLSRSGCCLMTRPVHEGEEVGRGRGELGGVNQARPQSSMNALLHWCGIGYMEEVGYYGTQSTVILVHFWCIPVIRYVQSLHK